MSSKKSAIQEDYQSFVKKNTNILKAARTHEIINKKNVDMDDFAMKRRENSNFVGDSRTKHTVEFQNSVGNGEDIGYISDSGSLDECTIDSTDQFDEFQVTVGTPVVVRWEETYMCFMATVSALHQDGSVDVIYDDTVHTKQCRELRVAKNRILPHDYLRRIQENMSSTQLEVPSRYEVNMKTTYQDEFGSGLDEYEDGDEDSTTTDPNMNCQLQPQVGTLTKSALDFLNNLDAHNDVELNTWDNLSLEDAVSLADYLTPLLSLELCENKRRKASTVFHQLVVCLEENMNLSVTSMSHTGGDNNIFNVGSNQFDLSVLRLVLAQIKVASACLRLQSIAATLDTKALLKIPPRLEVYSTSTMTASKSRRKGKTKNVPDTKLLAEAAASTAAVAAEAAADDDYVMSISNVMVLPEEALRRVIHLATAIITVNFGESKVIANVSGDRLNTLQMKTKLMLLREEIIPAVLQLVSGLRLSFAVKATPVKGHQTGSLRNDAILIMTIEFMEALLCITPSRNKLFGLLESHHPASSSALIAAAVALTRTVFISCSESLTSTIAEVSSPRQLICAMLVTCLTAAYADHKSSIYRPIRADHLYSMAIGDGGGGHSSVYCGQKSGWSGGERLTLPFAAMIACIQAEALPSLSWTNLFTAMKEMEVTGNKNDEEINCDTHSVLARASHSFVSAIITNCTAEKSSGEATAAALQTASGVLGDCISALSSPACGGAAITLEQICIVLLHRLQSLTVSGNGKNECKLQSKEIWRVTQLLDVMGTVSDRLCSFTETVNYDAAVATLAVRCQPIVRLLTTVWEKQPSTLDVLCSKQMLESVEPTSNLQKNAMEEEIVVKKTSKKQRGGKKNIKKKVEVEPETHFTADSSKHVTSAKFSDLLNCMLDLVTTVVEALLECRLCPTAAALDAVLADGGVALTYALLPTLSKNRRWSGIEHRISSTDIYLALLLRQHAAVVQSISTNSSYTSSITSIVAANTTLPTSIEAAISILVRWLRHSKASSLDKLDLVNTFQMFLTVNGLPTMQLLPLRDFKDMSSNSLSVVAISEVTTAERTSLLPSIPSFLRNPTTSLVSASCLLTSSLRFHSALAVHTISSAIRKAAVTIAIGESSGSVNNIAVAARSRAAKVIVKAASATNGSLLVTDPVVRVALPAMLSDRSISIREDGVRLLSTAVNASLAASVAMECGEVVGGVGGGLYGTGLNNECDSINIESTAPDQDNNNLLQISVPSTVPPPEEIDLWLEAVAPLLADNGVSVRRAVASLFGTVLHIAAAHPLRRHLRAALLHRLQDRNEEDSLREDIESIFSDMWFLPPSEGTLLRLCKSATAAASADSTTAQMLSQPGGRLARFSFLVKPLALKQFPTRNQQLSAAAQVAAEISALQIVETITFNDPPGTASIVASILHRLLHEDDTGPGRSPGSVQTPLVPITSTKITHDTNQLSNQGGTSSTDKRLMAISFTQKVVGAVAELLVRAEECEPALEKHLSDAGLPPPHIFAAHCVAALAVLGTAHPPLLKNHLLALLPYIRCCRSSKDDSNVPLTTVNISPALNNMMAREVIRCVEASAMLTSSPLRGEAVAERVISDLAETALSQPPQTVDVAVSTMITLCTKVTRDTAPMFQLYGRCYVGLISTLHSLAAISSSNRSLNSQELQSSKQVGIARIQRCLVVIGAICQHSGQCIQQLFGLERRIQKFEQMDMFDESNMEIDEYEDGDNDYYDPKVIARLNEEVASLPFKKAAVHNINGDQLNEDTDPFSNYDPLKSWMVSYLLSPSDLTPINIFGAAFAVTFYVLKEYRDCKDLCVRAAQALTSVLSGYPRLVLVAQRCHLLADVLSSPEAKLQTSKITYPTIVVARLLEGLCTTLSMEEERVEKIASDARLAASGVELANGPHRVLTAADVDSDATIAGFALQQHLPYILQALRRPPYFGDNQNPTVHEKDTTVESARHVRRAAAELIAKLLEQGLICPLDILTALVAALSDDDVSVTNISANAIITEDMRHGATFLDSRIVDGIAEGFQHALATRFHISNLRDITKCSREKMKTIAEWSGIDPNTGVALYSSLYNVALQPNRRRRQSFFSGVISKAISLISPSHSSTRLKDISTSSTDVHSPLSTYGYRRAFAIIQTIFLCHQLSALRYETTDEPQSIVSSIQRSVAVESELVLSKLRSALLALGCEEGVTHINEDITEKNFSGSLPVTPIPFVENKPNDDVDAILTYDPDKISRQLLFCCSNTTHMISIITDLLTSHSQVRGYEALLRLAAHLQQIYSLPSVSSSGEQDVMMSSMGNNATTCKDGTPCALELPLPTFLPTSSSTPSLWELYCHSESLSSVDDFLRCTIAYAPTNDNTATNNWRDLLNIIPDDDSISLGGESAYTSVSGNQAPILTHGGNAISNQTLPNNVAKLQQIVTSEMTKLIIFAAKDYIRLARLIPTLMETDDMSMAFEDLAAAKSASKLAAQQSGIPQRKRRGRISKLSATPLKKKRQRNVVRDESDSEWSAAEDSDQESNISDDESSDELNVKCKSTTTRSGRVSGRQR